MDEELAKRQHLAELREEHRKLDEMIGEMSEQGAVDQIELQRLKKRKLLLKDEIARLEDALLPDIIA
jgi:hypothetical protein